MRADLHVGDEAWCLLEKVAGTRSRSGTRRTVLGTARVKIDAIEGDSFAVTVLVANPSYMAGRKLERRREALYATTGKEHRAFVGLINLFWGSQSR